MTACPFRIGHGFDVHRLVPERKLILCGVQIPCEVGLLGHSDADVALHALMDALLGAAALGDIGGLFPDSDAAYKGIDSGILLKRVLEHPGMAEYELGNCDLTIVAQKPRLAPYIDEMRRKIAALFEVDIARISVKATTTEKLGYTGRGEGIAAHCVVLICKK